MDLSYLVLLNQERGLKVNFPKMAIDIESIQIRLLQVKVDFTFIYTEKIKRLLRLQEEEGMLKCIKVSFY